MVKPVVVDTNIVFSALTGRASGLLGVLFDEHAPEWLCPRYLATELFKHNDRLLKATELTEPALLDALNRIYNRCELVSERAISIGNWMHAFRLCADVDPKDVAFVALALERDALLWTNDQPLKDVLRSRGFDRFYSP